MTNRHTACVTYVLRDPITLEVRYVGLTLSPLTRAKMHRGRGAKSRTGAMSPVERWKSRLCRRGLCPIFEVHHCFPDYASGVDGEKSLIAYYARIFGPRLLNRESHPHFRGKPSSRRFVAKRGASGWFVPGEDGLRLQVFICNLCPKAIAESSTVYDYLGMNWGLCEKHSKSHRLQIDPMESGGVAVRLEQLA